MKEILDKYKGKEIGINVDRLSQIDSVEVLEVTDTYFTVRSNANQQLYHVPYTNVLKMVESSSGVEIRRFFAVNDQFQLVVKIGHSVNQNLA